MIRVEQKRRSDSSILVHFKTLEEAKEIEHFSGKSEEIVVFYRSGALDIYAGFGKRETIDSEKIREIVAKVFFKVSDLKKKNFAVNVPDWQGVDREEMISAIVESLFLTSYRFDKYKSKTVEYYPETVDIVTDGGGNSFDQIKIVCEATCYARDLVNDNAHVVTPAYLAKEARQWEKHPQCEITVFEEKDILEKKMGLLWAVGQGAPVKPRLILMHYRGNSNSSDTHAFVGKGVTFDSGGLNLKGAKNIVSMRQDMAGAAVCMALFRSVVLSERKCNIVCAVPSAYNAIGQNAYLPGDIYTSYSGKTVQIKNTDAEGRLILADALSYVCETYRPKSVVNLATLTGAILVSFAHVLAGLFSNNDSLSDSLFRAGEKTSERVWRMPLYKEYSEAMKGDIADVNNLSNFPAGYAGSITAAAFLKEFVDDDIPWAHLDIAGVAFLSQKFRSYVPANATGFGVRLLFEWLKTV